MDSGRGKMRGRPKLNIDIEKVKELAEIQCTQEEIAAILGLSRDTLYRNKEFCDIYEKKKAEGKQKLRQMQWDAAKKGNPTMLIWLGKQHLDQRDISHSEVTQQVDMTVHEQIRQMTDEEIDQAIRKIYGTRFT